MRSCHILILSEVDEKKSQLSVVGEWQSDKAGGIVRYSEGNDKSEVRWEGQKVFMERSGEVFLRLRFETGKELLGEIGTDALCTGSVAVRTERAEVSALPNGVKINLEYRLRFGSDKQRMQVRLNVRENLISQSEI